jgi:peroxiredoxin
MPIPTPRRKSSDPVDRVWLNMLRAILLSIAFTLAATASVASDNRLALPDRSFRGLDGKSHILQEWRGKVVLFNIWAPWCAPCQHEIRDFIRYQTEYSERGLQIIGLGLDRERRLRNVKRTLGINYPVLVDAEGDSKDLLRQWGNDTGLIPFSVIFDTTGRIAHAHMGVIDDEVFDEIVLPLLGPAKR